MHQFPRAISDGSIFPSFPCSLGSNRTLLGGPPSPGEMSSWAHSQPLPLCAKGWEEKRSCDNCCVLAPACHTARAFLSKSQAAPPAPAHQLHPCRKSASSMMWSTGRCRWSVQRIWTGEKPQYLVFPCHGQEAHSFSCVRVCSVGLMYQNDGLSKFFYFAIVA